MAESATQDFLMNHMRKDLLKGKQLKGLQTQLQLNGPPNLKILKGVGMANVGVHTAML